MRRIPTTSLRSTLLALLLTLCLALPALAAQKEGLLLVAFGTSVPEAQPALTAIDKEFKAAFPHSPVIWAYTSSIIRAKLEKKGVHIGDVAAGLEELARQKVDVVRVQSLHVVAGEEFSEMERLLVSWLVRHPDSFKAVYLGRPLLESRQDAEDVCRAVLGATEGKRKSGELLALMGHGQSHGRGDMIIEGMRATLADADNLAVLATVEGDIHDIGKNIVRTVLENYGFRIVDLGRDVPAERVVEAVRQYGAKIVGLSALMTTTVPSMEKTIARLHENGLFVPVIVGGAVLTPDYAKKIGADYYARDAKQSADIAKSILG